MSSNNWHLAEGGRGAGEPPGAKHHPAPRGPCGGGGGGAEGEGP